MRKIFFTGSKGFLGTHLVNRLRHSYPDYLIHEFSGGIEQFNSLRSEFILENWDIVIHFAGMSHIVDCENNPQKAYEVNTLGTAFLCELMRHKNFSGKVYFTSTAQVFEATDDEVGIIYNESSKIKPQNIYANTKYVSENILESFSKISDSQIKVLRLFNHTHKTQSARFFLPSVFAQINAAKVGDIIKVGNLNLERDFSLIDDFVDFFEKDISETFQKKYEIVNLSSGVPRNLSELLNILIRKLNKDVKIEVDAKLIRKVDPRKIVGQFKSSYSKNLSDVEFIEAFLRS